jgi:DNA repair protein RecO (recombination protein O)
LNALITVLLEEDDWPERYVRYELALLAELGFGLDLTACAVTGGQADLAYVSPTSGRAVGRAAAGAYAPRLLPLPGFLIGRGVADKAQIEAGLRLTGAFLQRHLFDAGERPLPAARERLLRRLAALPAPPAAM